MQLKQFRCRIGDFTLENDTETELSASSYAVSGPVGSGKSTFFKLLADPDLKDMGAFSEYPFLSYLSQDLTRLFAGNTLNTLLKMYAAPESIIGKHFSGGTFEDHCRTLELPFPRRSGDRLHFFSEGELQRLAIALAFSVESSLLLLDEPLTALNHRYRTVFYELVQQESRHRQIFLISHSLRDIRCTAEQVIPIQNGRLHPPLELKQFLELEDYLQYLRP